MDDAPAVAAGARPAELPVVAAVSLGGALGALARHGVEVLLPAAPGGVPWSTLLVNATGCLLIGVVMAILAGGHAADRAVHPPERRLARPFLATGVLGGYTTFSAYALDAHQMLLDGRLATAVAYALGTAVLALLAVSGGLSGTRWLLARQGRRP